MAAEEAEGGEIKGEGEREDGCFGRGEAVVDEGKLVSSKLETLRRATRSLLFILSRNSPLFL